MIWIFLAGGTGRAGIEGTLRGPRGPKKIVPRIAAAASYILGGNIFNMTHSQV